MLNPEQFKDWGKGEGEQLSLLPDLPSGMPDMGLVRGNPAMRLYRTVTIRPKEAPEDFDLNDEGTRHRVTTDVLKQIGGRNNDRGAWMSLGIHWNHERDWAQDYGHQREMDRHGEGHIPVIIEADHPGHEHVVNFDYDHRQGPPEEAVHRRLHDPALKGEARDWRLINDTVGHHNLIDYMLPEVPIRPGAPMRVRALHMRNDNDSAWHRIPVNHRGEA